MTNNNVQCNYKVKFPFFHANLTDTEQEGHQTTKRIRIEAATVCR